MSRTADRGQTTPLLAVSVVFALVFAVGLVKVGTAAHDRARASAAADAAALAAALDGPDAAEVYAEANGAELLDVTVVGTQATVVVQVGAARATARAEPTEASA